MSDEISSLTGRAVPLTEEHLVWYYEVSAMINHHARDLAAGAKLIERGGYVYAIRLQDGKEILFPPRPEDMP